MLVNTNMHLQFGRRKVFIVDTFKDLPVFGEEQNLYVVRSDGEGGNEAKVYEWYGGTYHFFKLGNVNTDLPTADDAAIEILMARRELPEPEAALENTLYVVISDETADDKTAMYLKVDGVLLLLASFTTIANTHEYFQVTKLGVSATTAAPKKYDIKIPYTSLFLRAPIEVLKFLSSNTNATRTEIEFDNADANDFITNEIVVFDGLMKLTTSLTREAKVTSIDGMEGLFYIRPINKGSIKELINLKNSAGVALLFFDGRYHSLKNNTITPLVNIDNATFNEYASSDLSVDLNKKELPTADILFTENSATIDISMYRNLQRIEINKRGEDN